MAHNYILKHKFIFIQPPNTKMNSLHLSRTRTTLILLLFYILLFSSSLTIVLTLSQTTSSSSSSSSKNCSSDSGPLKPTTHLVSFLERLQQTALDTFGRPNFDPKLYVDFSLQSSSQLSATEKAFDRLLEASNGSVSAGDLTWFLGEFLEGAGEDIVYVRPGDFVPEPEGFLPKVKNIQVRAWALKVHALWKNLSRKVSGGVLERPESHTLLPLAHPVVIPGSRFREVYYWDSYWIIRGLLASKMHETAKGIVTNLISLIEQYGYVLNGARAYYTNRSQPPLLSAMVCEIYKRTKDSEFTRKSLPALIKEHKFWNSGIHKVTVQDSKARNRSLTRYYAMWNKPRPESSTLDKEFASNISSDFEKRLFYREVASTAETGWDFSTRWMRNTSDFTTLSTTSILPVDLNAFILGMELNIAFLANVTGEENISKRFLKASRARKKAIQSVFWSSETGQWIDYWLSNSSCERVHKWDPRNRIQRVFASNFIPVWVEPFHSDAVLVDKVAKSLQRSGLVHPAGIATSTTNSGQQWDFPNGWAPIQHMIIEGLAKSSSKKARLLAEDVAIKWIRTNFAGYNKTGKMHEKYNVEKCGYFGGGGEYVPQTGFGWSNGVVLALLEAFGWPEDLKIDC